MKKFILKSLIIVSVVFFTLISSCTSNDCEYITVENVSGVNLCAPKNILNISTGIDESGNVIAPGTDVVDPYWRLINRPLYQDIAFSSANDLDLISSINGNAFVVNFGNANGSEWLNQNNSSSICPFNAGNTNINASTGTLLDNPASSRVPYIFERSFCVNSDTKLIIDIKGRSSSAYYCYFELINNFDNTIVNTSQIINSTVASWNDSVSVTPGVYSIRAYVSYRPGAGLPAFSAVGNISSADNSLAFSNNKNNCCSNNIVALTLINDGDCNNSFDSNIDTILYQNAVVNILNSSGTVVSTQNVDANGNIIFAGLSDGTYTVQIIIPDSPALISPNNFQVTLSNNEVKNFNIFACI